MTLNVWSGMPDPGSKAEKTAQPPVKATESQLAFEAFVSSEMGDVAVREGDRYISPKIQNFWKVWQGATAKATPQRGGHSQPW